MKLKEELLREHSRRQADSIARWVGGDKRRFRQLMDVFLKGEYVIAQRSAWVVGICVEREPGLIHPYLGRAVARMRQTDVHDAVRRNVVRILQFVPIPRRLQGTVATVCFEYLGSAGASIAVKAFSMTVLARIAQEEPDIGRELRLEIERQLPFAGAAFRARARMVLRMKGLN